MLYLAIQRLITFEDSRFRQNVVWENFAAEKDEQVCHTNFCLKRPSSKVMWFSVSKWALTDLLGCGPALKIRATVHFFEFGGHEG